MELLSSIVNFVLGLGSTLFVPLIIIIIGLIVRMKLKDALSAGLILGVAFVGVNMVVNFLIGALTPALNGFSEVTGRSFSVIDVGWPVASAITWTWPYIFLLFPLLIAINLIMLKMRWTNTLNIDFWNVWGKGFTSVIVAYFTGSPWIGLCAGIASIILELLVSDAIAPLLQKKTGIPGITMPHPMIISTIPMYPVDWVLRKIPALNKEFDADTLKEKIGMFGENHIIGFILGTLIALVGKFSIVDALTLGVQVGASFMVLPMVSKLFMQALAPLSEAASDFMKSKLGDRDIVIGLDWPFLAAQNELWVAMIIAAPISVLLALIVPGNATIPLAGILLISPAVAAFIVSSGNLIRMTILLIVTLPLELLAATILAEPLTNLAISTGAYAVPAGQQITFFGSEGAVMRAILALSAQGNIVGLILLPIFVICFILFYKDKKREGKQIRAENELLHN